MFGIPSLSAYALPIVGGIAAVAVIGAGIQTARVSSLKSDVKAEKALHREDIATWRAAGIQATADALIHARKIEAAQNAITKRIEDETRADIDAVRAKYERLRTARTNPGGTGKTNLPYDLGCLGITAEAPTCDRLLAYRERARFFAEQAELNTAQLNNFIDAYEAQSSIDRTPNEP